MRPLGELWGTQCVVIAREGVSLKFLPLECALPSGLSGGLL